MLHSTKRMFSLSWRRAATARVPAAMTHGRRNAGEPTLTRTKQRAYKLHLAGSSKKTDMLFANPSPLQLSLPLSGRVKVILIELIILTRHFPCLYIYVSIILISSKSLFLMCDFFLMRLCQC